MQKIKLFIFLIFIIFSAFAESAFFEPNAKIDERINRILQTLSAHSGVAVPNGFFQQPMNYAEIRAFLNEVEKSENLTQTDKELLVILQKRFSGNSKLFGFKSEDDKRSIFANLDLTANAKFYGDFDGSGIINPMISANLGVFSFYSDIFVSTQYRSDTLFVGQNYNPWNGPTYNVIGDWESHFRATDGFRGGISVQSKRARIDIAVDNLTGGPAVYNRLMLNAVNSPLFYTRASLDFGRLQYYQIFGLMKEFKDRNKFLYYHRAQIPFLSNRIILGLNASVISGSTGDSNTMSEPHGEFIDPKYLNRKRNIEPVYLIPFIPYFFAEHFVGDLDNKQISVDLEVKFPQMARWYVEFLLDDGVSPNTLFNDTWNNKWALTVGTQWFPVIGGKNTLFGLEYCRVEPWVYTHFYGVSTNFEHYGKGIGAALGPNSAQIRGTSEIYFTQRHGIRLEGVHSRFNRSVRGGNIGDVFVNPELTEEYGIAADNRKKEFLGKNYTSSYEISLSYLFRQFGRYEMETSFFYNKEKGAGIGLWGGWRF